MQYAWYKKQSKTIFNECVVYGLKCSKRYIGKINWVHEFVKGGKKQQIYVIDSLNIVWNLLGRKKQSDLMIFVLKLTSSFWKGFLKGTFLFHQMVMNPNWLIHITLEEKKDLDCCST
jgi:hypothetical protein